MSESTKQKEVAIGFCGDLSFSGHYTNKFNNDLFANEIKAFFSENDANVINFESPITPCRVTEKDYLAHRSDPEALEFIKKNINDPILSFANNHMMDYGDIGVIDTIDYTESLSIPTIGIGINLETARQGIIVGETIKVGIFSFQYKNKDIASRYHGGPLHESSIDAIEKTVKELRKECDYVVAVYHGGDEFITTPLPYTRKFLKKVLGFGIDVVVAHHPHVVQGYEFVGKKMIFYSLGNFIFDTDYQRIQEKTDQGALLRLLFRKDNISFEMVPTLIDRSTMKIELGSNSIFFRDINDTSYFREWCSACVHMETIKYRKKKLRSEVDAKKKDREVENDKKLGELFLLNLNLYREEQEYFEKQKPKKKSNESRNVGMIIIKKAARGAKKFLKTILLDHGSINKKVTQLCGALIAKVVFRVKVER